MPGSERVKSLGCRRSLASRRTVTACGNGIVTAGEVCDDGNDSNDDACLNLCVVATCGDGYRNVAAEECDDGNLSNDDYCAVTCQILPRRAFVTSSAHPPVVGLGGADSLCQIAADNAGLSGRYLAWLSTSSTSPSVRFVPSPVPYVTPSGIKIADNWADLTDGSLDAPHNENEFGGVPPNATGLGGALTVWSGTRASGILVDAAMTCGDWTNPLGGAHWGLRFSEFAWSALFVSPPEVLPCVTVAPFYCFQQ